jgi:hypothetical protein
MEANIGNSKAVYFQYLIEKSITWRTIRLNQCPLAMIMWVLIVINSQEMRFGQDLEDGAGAGGGETGENG